MTRGLKYWVCKAISYFWDLEVESVRSDVSGKLQVRMVNGRLLLDTSNANYSFGSLHRLFRKVFLLLDLSSLHPSGILLLGLGGGSVVSIIRDEYRLSVPVTAVEKDPEVIRLAHDHFGLGRHPDVEVVCRDAEEFVREDRTSFSLIIVDLFVGNDVPEPFTGMDFLGNCSRILAPGGTIVLNFICSSEAQATRYATLQENLNRLSLRYAEHRFFSTNRVLLIRQGM